MPLAREVRRPTLGVTSAARVSTFHHDWLGRTGELTARGARLSSHQTACRGLGTVFHLHAFKRAGISVTGVVAAERLRRVSVEGRVASIPRMLPPDEDVVLYATSNVEMIEPAMRVSIRGSLDREEARLLASGSASSRLLRKGLRVEFASVLASQEYVLTCHGLDSPTGMATAPRMRECEGASPSRVTSW